MGFVSHHLQRLVGDSSPIVGWCETLGHLPTPVKTRATRCNSNGPPCSSGVPAPPESLAWRPGRPEAAKESCFGGFSQWCKSDVGEFHGIYWDWCCLILSAADVRLKTKTEIMFFYVLACCKGKFKGRAFPGPEKLSKESEYVWVQKRMDMFSNVHLNLNSSFSLMLMGLAPVSGCCRTSPPCRSEVWLRGCRIDLRRVPAGLEVLGFLATFQLGNSVAMLFFYSAAFQLDFWLDRASGHFWPNPPGSISTPIHGQEKNVRFLVGHFAGKHWAQSPARARFFNLTTVWTARRSGAAAQQKSMGGSCGTFQGMGISLRSYKKRLKRPMTRWVSNEKWWCSIVFWCFLFVEQRVKGVSRQNQYDFIVFHAMKQDERDQTFRRVLFGRNAMDPLGRCFSMCSMIFYEHRWVFWDADFLGWKQKWWGYHQQPWYI